MLASSAVHQFRRQLEMVNYLSKMVGPYDEGRVIRSLVRVPGSGTDNAIIFDLSRISTVASPVSRTVPTLQQQQSINIETLTGKKEVPTPQQQQQNKHIRPSKYTFYLCSQDKKDRTFILNLVKERDELRRQKENFQQIYIHYLQLFRNKEKLIYLLRMLGIDAISTTNVNSPPTKSPQVNSPPTKSPQVNSPPTKTMNSPQVIKTRDASIVISQLLKEKVQHRSQKKELQRKISLLEQLFCNKERLIGVAQRLGINVNVNSPPQVITTQNTATRLLDELKEKNRLLMEEDILLMERDRLLMERDRLLKERDQLLKERNQLRRLERLQSLRKR